MDGNRKHEAQSSRETSAPCSLQVGGVVSPTPRVASSFCDLREEGSGSLSESTQSVMVGKVWRQEHEAAGHTASAVRKQRMDAGTQLAFSFSSVPGLWGPPTCLSSPS